MTLLRLAAPAEPQAEAALRAFELVLLKGTGVLPDLSRVTLTQQPVNDEARYTLLPEAGIGAPRANEPDLPGALLVELQAALGGARLDSLQARCAQALPQLKPMLRALLHYHLGSSPLRTRQVMLDLQSLERRASPT
jgi:DNA repair protein RecO (recombination protein O)